MHECRLIIDWVAPGAWNMAVDEALLHDAAENGRATLRFYAWSEPTLSLGYFQRAADRDRHTASHECAIVRRQTGGGAILHDREITYSVALPRSHPLARSAPALYVAVHDTIVSVLNSFAAHGRGYSLFRLEECPKTTDHEEPFLCFQRRALGDVLLIQERDRGLFGDSFGERGELPRGVKILGSAQRRYGGALLQHGSLLLERSPLAPELAGWRDLTGAEVALTKMVDAIASGLENVMSGRGIRCSLPKDLQLAAADIANKKYSTAAWTNRR